MPKTIIHCLICQSKNEVNTNNKELGHCSQCGMPLSDNHHDGSKARKKRFLPFFWFIVIFCLVMVIYLPR